MIFFSAYDILTCANGNETARRTLIFAAQDTTSAALSRILHMLAIHKEAQERLRHEITEARILAKGDISYDELHALPFLDAVCRETLRL